MFFWDPTFPKLVGGIPTPAEKYELVSWDDYSQYMEKQKKQTTNQKIIWVTTGQP